MKKILSLICLAALCLSMCACGAANTPANTQTPAPSEPAASEAPTVSAQPTPDPQPALDDGVYTAEFSTDSTMFHVNEAHEDKGVLTVKNGEMMLHVSLAGKGVLKLFIGTAEDAQKDGAVHLDYTADQVTYPDGITDEVYGFDIPVPVLEEEFDCALYGKKGTWYDHKVYPAHGGPRRGAGGRSVHRCGGSGRRQRQGKGRVSRNSHRTGRRSDGRDHLEQQEL